MVRTAKRAQTGKERDLVMIVMEKKGDGLEAVVWSEAPTIYMDTWALNLFSRTERCATGSLSCSRTMARY